MFAGDLEDVVRFIIRAALPTKTCRLDQPLGLSESEIADLVVFLKS